MTRAAAKAKKLSVQERFAQWVASVGGVRASAAILKVAPSTVTRLVTGQRGISGALATRIQQVSKIPAVDWFKGSDS